MHIFSVHPKYTRRRRDLGVSQTSNLPSDRRAKFDRLIYLHSSAPVSVYPSGIPSFPRLFFLPSVILSTSPFQLKAEQVEVGAGLRHEL